MKAFIIERIWIIFHLGKRKTKIWVKFNKKIYFIVIYFRLLLTGILRSIFKDNKYDG